MTDQLIQRIKQCPTLPSLPTVAMQVLELTQKDMAGIDEIAHIISKDAALSSKILRTVNSSFYGRSQQVSTITQALVILGLQSVKTLVLGFSLVSNLSKNRSKGFKHITYWRRSIYAATAARSMAAKLNLVQQEECFLVGLLMDIGMLVLDQILGESYGEANEKAKIHSHLPDIEQQNLGITHAEAAGVLADQWKLPPLLGVPIKFHHRPGEVTDPALKKITEVAFIASRIADIFVDEQPAEAIAEVRQYCKVHYQITEADCDILLDQIGRRTQEVAPLFEIHIASSANYDNILKKANEALVELTLKSQFQADSLKQQNQELQTQATTDALTGLANRGRFDQVITEQFDRALRNNSNLALLMLDVDKFKNVNDTYGHQIGDQVLRFLGRLLKSAVRAQDLAARYGGEEMTIILPGANRAAAAVLAETIRKAVATRPVACGAQAVSITISIGVSALEPGAPFREVSQFIKAADMSVYAAKHGGRNCVRVFSPRPALAAPVAA